MKANDPPPVISPDAVARSLGAKRRANAAFYNQAFADVADITTPYTEPVSESIFNQYTLRVPRRDELKALLDLASKGNDSMVNLTFSDQGKGLFELLDAYGITVPPTATLEQIRDMLYDAEPTMAEAVAVIDEVRCVRIREQLRHGLAPKPTRSDLKPPTYGGRGRHRITFDCVSASGCAASGATPPTAPGGSTSLRSSRDSAASPVCSRLWPHTAPGSPRSS